MIGPSMAGIIHQPLGHAWGQLHCRGQDNHALIDKLQEERRRLRAQVEEISGGLLLEFQAVIRKDRGRKPGETMGK